MSNLCILIRSDKHPVTVAILPKTGISIPGTLPLDPELPFFLKRRGCKRRLDEIGNKPISPSQRPERKKKGQFGVVPPTNAYHAILLEMRKVPAAAESKDKTGGWNLLWRLADVSPLAVP